MRSNLILIIFFFLSQIVAQSQEEILSDLREDDVPSKGKSSYPKDLYLDHLRAIFLKVAKALENKEDRRAIEEANALEKTGIVSAKINIRGKAELGDEQILYLKIRRLRGEAYYNLREFKNALIDSRFIVENHPRPVVFDFTRYAVSLYYSGDDKTSRRILTQAKIKFKNENDQSILIKTTQFLFPEY